MIQDLTLVDNWLEPLLMSHVIVGPVGLVGQVGQKKGNGLESIIMGFRIYSWGGGIRERMTKARRDSRIG